MAVEYQAGDIVLIEFPFTTGGMKHRPALVLLDTGDADVVVARITSQALRDSFDVTISDWSAAGLRLPSIVRLHKIAALEKTLIQRKMGRITSNDWVLIQNTLRNLWANVLGVA